LKRVSPLYHIRDRQRTASRGEACGTRAEQWLSGRWDCGDDGGGDSDRKGREGDYVKLIYESKRPERERRKSSRREDYSHGMPPEGQGMGRELY